MQGKYILRRDAWQSFDPYFPLFSQQELHCALERSARFLPVDSPLPKPHRPFAAFADLPFAVLSSRLHSALYAVLASAACMSSLVTERMLMDVARLLELAADAHVARCAAPQHMSQMLSDDGTAAHGVSVLGMADVVENVLTAPASSLAGERPSEKVS